MASLFFWGTRHGLLSDRVCHIYHLTTGLEAFAGSIIYYVGLSFSGYKISMPRIQLEVCKVGMHHLLTHDLSITKAEMQRTS